jgi:hypothetical protein
MTGAAALPRTTSCPSSAPEYRLRTRTSSPATSSSRGAAGAASKPGPSTAGCRGSVPLRRTCPLAPTRPSTPAALRVLPSSATLPPRWLMGERRYALCTTARLSEQLPLSCGAARGPMSRTDTLACPDSQRKDGTKLEASAMPPSVTLSTRSTASSASLAADGVRGAGGGGRGGGGVAAAATVSPPAGPPGGRLPDCCCSCCATGGTRAGEAPAPARALGSDTVPDRCTLPPASAGASSMLRFSAGGLEAMLACAMARARRVLPMAPSVSLM